MVTAASVVIVTLPAVVFAAAVVRWATRWGANAKECGMPMAGDEWLQGGPPARVAMTRAISIAAPPDIVWPWLAQLGRGAGWYSFDLLDNGGKRSARHLVSWIPAPWQGDATAIGYLRHLESGRDLAWWVPGEPFLGAMTRMVFSIRLRPDGQGSRLVTRIAADASGPHAWLLLGLFRVIDSIMAIRQLLGIKERVEHCGAPAAGPQAGETGARDQYQLYEVIYASGEKAGIEGQEMAARWRQAAREAGVIEG
jgi:hypothetical protein